MVFKSGWSKQDIWSLTYKELFEYLIHYFEIYSDDLLTLFKSFCAYNAQSSAIAYHGKKGDVDKYIKAVSKMAVKTKEENNLDDRFKGVDFG